MMNCLKKNDLQINPSSVRYFNPISRLVILLFCYSRYIEEHVQRTGVAIETQGFTFITSGRKRESLTGNATLHLYQHFEPLRQIEGEQVDAK